MTAAVTVRFAQDLAIITVDNPPVNATSTAVRTGLLAAVETVANSVAKAAILICAGRTFIAGGDMSEFDAPPPPNHICPMSSMPLKTVRCRGLPQCTGMCWAAGLKL